MPLNVILGFLGFFGLGLFLRFLFLLCWLVPTPTGVMWSKVAMVEGEGAAAAAAVSSVFFSALLYLFVVRVNTTPTALSKTTSE